MKLSPIRPFLLLPLTLILGCGFFGTTTEVTFENEGQICFGDDPWGGGDRSGLQAGEPLELTVVFHSCLSSSCTDFQPTSCEIAVDGDTITLTSQGSYVDLTARERACTDDCGVLSARCTGPALDEGTYTIVHGDQTYTVEVPGAEQESSCLE